MREHSGEMQRPGMLRSYLENLVEELACLSELLVFLQEDGDVDCLIERQLVCRASRIVHSMHPAAIRVRPKTLKLPCCP